MSIIPPPRSPGPSFSSGRRRRFIQHRPVPLHHIRVVGLDRKLIPSLIKPTAITHAVIWYKLHAASRFFSSQMWPQQN
nr:MAG TPA: hypothetical protein [Caudoviricetes sp.]